MKLTDKEYRNFNNGFTQGDYASAYKTTDYDVFLDKLPGNASFVCHHFRMGCLLGFFNTYELHEIPSEWRDTVELARSNYKDFV